MRLLALGPQVYEIDLVGAHYEALRHITNALGLQPALLPVAQARTTLEEGCPAPRGTWAALSPKRLLNYAINSSASRAIAQLHQGGIAFLSQAAKDVLQDVDRAKTYLGQHVAELRFYQTDDRSTARNWIYFVLEAAESAIARALVRELLPACPGGLVWLHDGLYARGPSVDLPRAQQAVSAGLHTVLHAATAAPGLVAEGSADELVRASSLAGPYGLLLQELAASSPVPHPIRSRSAFTAQARPRRRERGPATEEQALVAHRKRVARQEDHRNKRHCRGIQSFFRAARPRDEPQLIG